MKLFLLALVIISATAVFADGDADWQNFKMQFGKLFLSPGKEAKRKAAFHVNKAVHDDLKAASAAGDIAFEPAIYAFHDLSTEDFLARMTGLEHDESSESDSAEAVVATKRQNIPTDYDSKAYLGAIRNQQQCGK